MTLIVDLDPIIAESLAGAIGEESTVLPSLDALRRTLESEIADDTVVLGPSIDQISALALTESLRVSRPTLGVVLVRRRIDTTVLSEALRSGVREVVEERDLAGVHAAVRRSRELTAALRSGPGHGGEAVPAERRGRVVTVFSAKGGCGKTTLSTNLAAALADGGRREVCLVDLDLAFGDVAIALQLFPTHTIADAVPLGDTLDFTGLHALLTPHSPGLTCLVAPVDPGSASSIPAELVGRILNLLRDHFDYVIIDTPPAFDDQVLAAFDVSDVVALIATLDIPALKNLKLTLETLELLNYPRDRWKVVLNRADSKVGLAAREVEKTIKTTIASQIPSSREVPAAINRGVPIVLDQPRHSVSQAIRSFAERYIVVASTSTANIPPELRSDRRTSGGGLLRRKAKSK